MLENMKHSFSPSPISGYTRIPFDAYHTIDKRAVIALNEVWSVAGKRILEPCAGKGCMMRDLEHKGAQVVGTDLLAYPDADPRIVTPLNLFDLTGFDIARNNVEAAVTNPPFKHVAEVTRHLLKIAPDSWVVILARAQFLFARKREDLYRSARFHALVPLPFRLNWFEHSLTAGTADHAWYLWRPASWARIAPVVWFPSPQPIGLLAENRRKTRKSENRKTG